MRKFIQIWVTIFIFTANFIYSNSSRKELKEQILKFSNNQQINETIPLLKEYTERFESDIYFNLLYGKNLLFRTDFLVEILDDSEIKSVNYNKMIRKNYDLSARILEKNVTLLNNVEPKNRFLGKWYFIWALAEWYANNKNRAIGLFKKSIKLDFKLNEANYNIAVIFESLGQFQDSKIYFEKYLQNEKIFEEENNE